MEEQYPLKEIPISEEKIKTLSDGFLCGVEEIDFKRISRFPKGKHILQYIKSYNRNLN